MAKRIVQVLPAQGVRAVYADPDGAMPGYSLPVHVLALHDDGSLAYLEADLDGSIRVVTEHPRFLRLEFEGDAIRAPRWSRQDSQRPNPQTK